MEKVHTEIEKEVTSKENGDIIFAADFRGKGEANTIKQALFRLVKSGKIQRLAKGIYYKPKIDPLLGPLKPGPEELIQALEEKEKIRIIPGGALAMNMLGITTQVPTRMVYLTDGSPRTLKLGNLEIKLKTTSPKRLSRKGKISALLIQALEEMDLERIDEPTQQKLKELLQKENPQTLKHDLSLTSTRINDYIYSLLNTPEQ
ncbi:MAG: DUF6088 family protein [Puia sp.]|nr:DUF6088 family protein [Puia sp.]